MKFTCSQQDLSTHLSLVGRAIASRPTHPIMANVLVEALVETDQSTIVLTGFDGDLGIKTAVTAKVSKKGNVTLPAKLLTDIVGKLPQGDVTITITEKDDSLSAEIKSTSGKYKIQGIGADEFPELPEVEGNTVTLPYEAVIEGLQGTLFATSTDDAKGILKGVHFTLGESLEFAATDGHRLSVVTTTGESIGAALNCTVPASALAEVQRMASTQKTPVTVQFSDTLAVFECGAQRVTTRLLEGQYPNYHQLIPKQFSHQVTVDRTSLLASLNRIAVLADQKNNVVKLSFDDVSVVLSVDAADVGSGQETLDCQTVGDGLDIAFNVKYLVDGLKAISTNEVLLCMGTATSPTVIQPVDGGKMIYLIMPVQVRE